ncbi:hypothetical protein ABH925_002941 [Streptacidiphilus sp. EB129]
MRQSGEGPGGVTTLPGATVETATIWGIREHPQSRTRVRHNPGQSEFLARAPLRTVPALRCAGPGVRSGCTRWGRCEPPWTRSWCGARPEAFQSGGGPATGDNRSFRGGSGLAAGVVTALTVREGHVGVRAEGRGCCCGRAGRGGAVIRVRAPPRPPRRPGPSVAVTRAGQGPFRPGFRAPFRTPTTFGCVVSGAQAGIRSGPRAASFAPGPRGPPGCLTLFGCARPGGRPRGGARRRAATGGLRQPQRQSWCVTDVGGVGEDRGIETRGPGRGSGRRERAGHRHRARGCPADGQAARAPTRPGPLPGSGRRS